MSNRKRKSNFQKLLTRTVAMNQGQLVSYNLIDRIMKSSTTSGSYGRTIRRWKEALVEDYNVRPTLVRNRGYRLVSLDA